MKDEKYIALQRDVKAIAVPSGQDVTLFKGTEVRITQKLGGTFTVITHQSSMANIAGEDADALGETVPQEIREKVVAHDEDSLQEAIRAKLKTVYDPEIPHSVVDLGLIYGIETEKLEDQTYRVVVAMTLTAPGCGMGDVMCSDAQKKILSIENVKECKVNLVFDPPWSIERMNPVLRREMY